MVLIIVSRNIDLSVGSLLGFLGYTMAMVQAIWIPTILGLGFDQPVHLGRRRSSSASSWARSSAALQGFIVAYGGVPVVHRHARRLPRLARRSSSGIAAGPDDRADGPRPSSLHRRRRRTARSASALSWVLGVLACVGDRLHSSSTAAASGGATASRSDRSGPRSVIAVLGCVAVLAAVWVANNYFWPPSLADQYAATRIAEPPGGLQIATGIAFPVRHPHRRRRSS